MDIELILELQVLNEITENILQNPEEPRYRRLKITSKRMNEHIMPRNGTVEFLQRVCSSYGGFCSWLTDALWEKMGFRQKVCNVDLL